MDITLCMDGNSYSDMEMDDGCDDGDYEKDDEAGFAPDSLFYKTGFTKVSEFLAFDQMPNLIIRINRTSQVPFHGVPFRFP